MQDGSEGSHRRTEDYSGGKKKHHSAGATEAAFGCNPGVKGLGERSENSCHGFARLAEVEVARTGGAALEGKRVAWKSLRFHIGRWMSLVQSSLHVF